MDKNIKDFLRISVLLSVMSILPIIVLGYISTSFTLAAYNYIMLVVIWLLIFIAAALIILEIAVFIAYRRKKAGTVLFHFAMSGIKFLLPFLISVSEFFKGSKDSLRRFYIEVNNILVQSRNQKYYSNEILIILPHCLQNSGCSYKITYDINNCKRCGKCTIGEIAEMSKKMKVEATVVTGGTAARNVVAVRHPGIVLSVACERDLASGMADIGKTPVIGILNERPYGPCKNTYVNVQQLKEKLDGILINEC